MYSIKMRAGVSAVRFTGRRESSRWVINAVGMQTRARRPWQTVASECTLHVVFTWMHLADAFITLLS